MNVIIREQDVTNERDEEHTKNLVTEVKKLTSNFAKLESTLAMSKNINTVLSGRLIQMGRQC